MCETFRDRISLRDFDKVEYIRSGPFGTINNVFDYVANEQRTLHIMYLDRDCDLQQIDEEIQWLATLSHDNIAKIYGAGFDTAGHKDDEPYSIEGTKIVFQDGQSLCPKYVLVLTELSNNLLSQNLPEYHNDCDLRIDVMKQILNALFYLHREGISNRNLNINTIMIDSDGVAKVCDYGFTHENLKIQSTGVKGNNGDPREYQCLPPEILRSCSLKNTIKLEDLEKADVYEFGIIWLQLCVDPFSDLFYKLLSIFRKGSFAATAEHMFGKEAVLLSKILVANRSRRLTIKELFAEVIERNLSRCESTYNRSDNNCRTNKNGHFGKQFNIDDQSLRNRILQLEAECGQIESKITQMTAEKVEMEKSKIKLEEDDSFWQNKLIEQDAKITQLEKQHSDNEKRIDEMFLQKKENVKQTAAFSTKNKYLKDENDSMIRNQNSMKSIIERQENQISSLGEEKTEIDKRCNSWKVANSSFAEKTEEVRKERDKFVKDVNEKVKKIEGMHNNVLALVKDKESSAAKYKHFVDAVDDIDKQLVVRKNDAIVAAREKEEWYKRINDYTRSEARQAGYSKGRYDNYEECHRDGVKGGKKATSFWSF